MKKITTLILIIGLIAILSAPTARADFSQRIQVDEVISKRSIAITHPETSDKYLLYLGNGCGDLKQGQSVTLTVKGALNGWYDTIKIDATHSCDIEEADIFTDKLYVLFVHNSNTETRVKDVSGLEYNLDYGPSCHAMPGYLHKYIYVSQGADAPEMGDRIIFPDDDGQCTISDIRKIDRQAPAAEVPSKAPSAVTRVKAIPRNGSVSLIWRPATDDKGVSYYVISYDKYKISAKNTPLEDMPNRRKTDSIRYTITGLENEEPYYFYVIAVDTDGNPSSYWSDEVVCTPKSSIMPTASIADSLRTINLRVANESAGSFLIRWNTLPGQSRQTVFFEADGEREFSRTNYDTLHMRILKRDHRKGKQLTFKVRVYGLKGIIQEEEISFDF